MERQICVFIDLFAGLGGFHIALSKLGHQCVFASEIVVELKELYQQNFGIEVSGDITKIPLENIPSHDILCAGFPCQPFSKAGRQKGMEEERGKLIDRVIEILEYHKPKYFILENVRNLEKNTITDKHGNQYIRLCHRHLNFPIHRKWTCAGNIFKLPIENYS